jgi:hypothetical protein
VALWLRWLAVTGKLDSCFRGSSKRPTTQLTWLASSRHMTCGGYQPEVYSSIDRPLSHIIVNGNDIYVFSAIGFICAHPSSMCDWSWASRNTQRYRSFHHCERLPLSGLGAGDSFVKASFAMTKLSFCLLLLLNGGLQCVQIVALRKKVGCRP